MPPRPLAARRERGVQRSSLSTPLDLDQRHSTLPPSPPTEGGGRCSRRCPASAGSRVDHDETIVAALYENRIAFVDTAGKVSIIGGTGAEGYTATAARRRRRPKPPPRRRRLRIDREVVVADSHNGVLRRIDPAGTVTTIARRFKAPVALSAGAGNTLFVADSQAGAIYKLSPDGGTRRLVGRAIAPANITLDERDRIYVTELAGAHRLLQITNGRARVLVRGAS